MQLDGTKETAYGWVMNEFCYARYDNMVKAYKECNGQFEAMLASDKSLQASFKANILEFINEIKWSV